MKRAFVTSFFVIGFAIAGFSQTNYTYNSDAKAKAAVFANEIFKDYPSYITPKMLSLFEAHLNRVEVKKITETPDENYILLSSVTLINKYNTGLTRDNGSFDFAGFNPLKYALNFDAAQEVAYRIDNTDYVIFIHKP